MTFPKNFFQEEVRDGFTVPELMKRAWGAQMEVLEIVADLCRKHNITWFADWGTLLGSVRHHGFIPWDDDIDIALLRPDYNRLMELLKTEPPDGFVLAGIHAKNERLQNIYHIVQARVIADNEYWEFTDYMKRFHGFPVGGIGIDIFPLDYLPRDPELAGLQRGILQKIWILLKRWEKDKNYSATECEEELQEIEELCNITLARDRHILNHLYQLFDSVSALFTEEESDFLTDFQYYVTCSDQIFRKECYKTFIDLPFEQISIPVPVGYAEILTNIFGDYHIAVKGTSDHDYPFYKDQIPKIEQMLRQRGIMKNVTEYCRDFMRQERDDEF